MRPKDPTSCLILAAVFAVIIVPLTLGVLGWAGWLVNWPWS